METSEKDEFTQFVIDAVRVLEEGFIPEVAEKQLAARGLTESEVSIVMARAENIAGVRAAEREKARGERPSARFRYGLILTVAGVVGTVGSYVLARHFGFPTYAVFVGLVAVGIWMMATD